jgi:hypothetical protein
VLRPTQGDDAKMRPKSLMDLKLIIGVCMQGYEDNHKENEEVEKKHSNTMLTDYDEELRLLEEWLVNPKIEEECIAIATQSIQ